MTTMEEHIDYLISGPPFDITFSPVDQVTPPVYSRRVLIFSRDDAGQEQVVDALKTGLQRTVDEIPILAGQMGYSPAGWTVKNGQARLRIKTVDIGFPELEVANFPESMLPADKLSSVPALTDPQSEWHACRIQANFIRGGLLLVVSINHTTMDGYGITKAIEALARNCRTKVGGAPSGNLILDRSVFPDSTVAPDATRLASYNIVRGTPNLGPLSSRVITASFRLSVPSLEALKRAAFPAEGWITTHDALNALCWRAHARGRFKTGLISDQDIARFAFPVDFRRLTQPPLPAQYIGNSVLMNKVELSVKALLAPNGLSQAAAAIRTGVREVDAAYVENFIAVAKSLETPSQLKINLKLQERNTAFGSTSYKSFSHSTLDWDPVLGRFERMRLSAGVTGEGMSIIMPVLRDGSWEVTVTIEEELYETFKNDEEWVQYMS